MHFSKPWVAIATLCALVFLGVWYAFFSASSTAPIGTTEYWIWRIQEVGGEYADQEFHRYAAALSENEAHTAAHTFARGLYEVEGVSSIRYCDENFAQGCAHEIMGRAIHEFGTDIIPELQENCAAVFEGGAYFCDHGVGHGLVDYYGYDAGGIMKALAYCEAHENEDELNGCYTGVFMEFFLQNVRYSSTIPKEFMAAFPYDRCTEDEEMARWLCFYTLPLWWHQIEKYRGEGSEEDILTLMHKRCSAIPARKDSFACLHGMGHMVAPMAEYDLGRVEYLCGRISQIIPDRLICISDAAYHILLEKHEPLGLPLCAPFTEDSRVYCEAYATTVVQKDIRVLLPQ